MTPLGTKQAINTHNIYESSHQDIRQQINDLDAQKAEQSDLLVERARINGFTTLEEGSTTGDAELMDIRVAYTGTTYPSSGDAVREQTQTTNNKCATAQ